jgi:hypothetical protein
MPAVNLTINEGECLITKEGPAFVEYKIEGSEQWSNAGPKDIGMRVAKLIADLGDVVELKVASVGRPWTVKRAVSAGMFRGD